jgi:hypothetical protein
VTEPHEYLTLSHVTTVSNAARIAMAIQTFKSRFSFLTLKIYARQADFAVTSEYSTR